MPIITWWYLKGGKFLIFKDSPLKKINWISLVELNLIWDKIVDPSKKISMEVQGEMINILYIKSFWVE